MSVVEFLQVNIGNLIAVVWFLICFRGYRIYTSRRSIDTPTLAFAMHRYRKQWIRKALRRENRIADTNVIANLERNVSFFASTTLFVLAGLMTVLGSSSETVIMMLVESISKMASKAAGNFNNGLRTYYFSMAVLGWFVNYWVFMLLSVLVVAVLYRREFRSDTLSIMMSNLPD